MIHMPLSLHLQHTVRLLIYLSDVCLIRTVQDLPLHSLHTSPFAGDFWYTLAAQ